MSDLIQHTVRGNKLVQACTRLDLARRKYSEGEIDEAFLMVHNMFVRYNRDAVESVLNGRRMVWMQPEKNSFFTFFDESEEAQ